MRKHWKLLVFLFVEFLVAITVVILTMFAGRKSFTVTFDLNGGTHISGSLVQTIRYGNSATLPEATKEGSYLLGWDQPHTQITKDVTIKAIWEYKTSYGIEFEYVGNSNYCLISGSYDNISGDVYIGSYHNGMKVLGIKSGAFKNCTRITGIYLLDGIVSIESEAFAGCTNLKTIEIPSTVEIIGSNILKGCNKLERMSVPFIGDVLGESTKTNFGYFFGTNMYAYNKKYVPESLKEVYINGRCEIPNTAFYNCLNIKNVVFSNGVTKIGENAFRKCESLESITIGNGVTEIANTAFLNCTNLKNVYLGENVEKIGEAAFANCPNLEMISIPASVKEIASNAFQNSPLLKTFNINENNEYFYLENNLLTFENNEEKITYTIEETEYTDDFVDFSEIVIGPVIRPGIDDYIKVPDDKIPEINDEIITDKDDELIDNLIKEETDTKE